MTELARYILPASLGYGQEEPRLPLFHLVYERKPFNSAADYKLHIRWLNSWPIAVVIPSSVTEPEPHRDDRYCLEPESNFFWSTPHSVHLLVFE